MKRSVHKYDLISLGWGDKHEMAYISLQEQLHNAVKLAHRDESKDLCIFTDASNRY